MSYEGVFEFYRGRIESAPLYGFKSGMELLDVIVRCADVDSMLTDKEYNSIINQAYLCQCELMEDNYNEGWK